MSAFDVAASIARAEGREEDARDGPDTTVAMAESDDNNVCAVQSSRFR
ncbi:MAG: hypothetical protein ACFHHU_03300 [Porticoccaceae bacterium]